MLTEARPRGLVEEVEVDAVEDAVLYTPFPMYLMTLLVR